MVHNEAAWITAAKTRPLQVDTAPEPKAKKGEVVIRNAAVALNPADWKIQNFGIVLDRYPNILGFDVAGIIESVGEDVTHLHVGQRVMGFCNGSATGDPSNMAFQLYVATSALSVSPIPDNMSFEKAVVLPTAITTAAAGLYQKNHLALALPNLERRPTGQTLLVWGGASSVGAAAIRLAVASGLDVITTASSHNYNLVKGFGASQVIDYKSATVVEKVVEALQNITIAGVFDAITTKDSITVIGAILNKIGTSKVALVGTVDPLPSSIHPLSVYCLTILQEENQEICKAVWQDFVPHALQIGRLEPKPDPWVIGTGLERIQDGLDTLKAGVSAKKIVVKLQE